MIRAIALCCSLCCASLASPAVCQDLVDTVTEMIQAGDLRDASALVDKRVSESTGDDITQLIRARQTVAAAFVQIRDHRSAYEEMQKLFEFQLKNVADDTVQSGLPTTLVNMGAHARRLQRIEELLQAYDRAITALKAVTDYEAISEAASSMTIIKGLKSQSLVSMDRRDEATQMLEAELGKVRGLYEANQDDKSAVQLYARAINNLMRATADEQLQKDLYQKHQSLLLPLLETEPADNELNVQYLSAAIFWLDQLAEKDPEAGLGLITDARKRIETVLEEDPSVGRSMQLFQQLIGAAEQRLKAVMTIQDLIGEPAPTFDAEHWINGEPTTNEELKGKVVLLNFWSVVDGRSQRMFPQLQRWREDFADKGLQILGATRHFNLKWNEETQQPQLIRDQRVPAEEENAMIEKFLDRNRVTHPTLVMPRRTQMAFEYGIVELPHFVLIDKQGIVRLIKSGLKTENEQEIEDMIRQLLDEE